MGESTPDGVQRLLNAADWDAGPCATIGCVDGDTPIKEAIVQVRPSAMPPKLSWSLKEVNRFTKTVPHGQARQVEDHCRDIERVLGVSPLVEALITPTSPILRPRY